MCFFFLKNDFFSMVMNRNGKCFNIKCLMLIFIECVLLFFKVATILNGRALFVVFWMFRNIKFQLNIIVPSISWYASELNAMQRRHQQQTGTECDKWHCFNMTWQPWMISDSICVWWMCVCVCVSQTIAIGNPSNRVMKRMFDMLCAYCDLKNCCARGYGQKL